MFKLSLYTVTGWVEYYPATGKVYECTLGFGSKEITWKVFAEFLIQELYKRGFQGNPKPAPGLWL